MKISVASGKGGTGKTTIAVNLALAIDNCQILDCDVEEPNVQIFLQPKIEQTIPVNVIHPVISEEKCTKCGTCVEACEFNALALAGEQLLFFPELCMSCGACIELCPENAISEKEYNIGEVQIGSTKEDIAFVAGLLNIGIPRAIPIIEAVKEQTDETRTAIFDAPPGNSCPVIDTINGTDFCLLVTEPTPFGLWDLRIAVEVTKQLAVPCGIIINRYGLGGEEALEKYCQEENIPILMTIPFDRGIAEAYSEGKTLLDYQPQWRDKFIELFNRIKELTQK